MEFLNLTQLRNFKYLIKNVSLSLIFSGPFTIKLSLITVRRKSTNQNFHNNGRLDGKINVTH